MESTKVNAPRLFAYTAVENKDEIEERYEKAYAFLQSLIAGLSEKETHDALNNAICKEKTHEEVTLGLLTSILTDPQNAAKSYRDLTLVTRDGLASVLNNLSSLILERYLRFNDTARSQLTWLVREMIKNAVNNVDNICWNLMRYASGGDITPKNIALIESLLDIFIDNRVWLDKSPVLICSSVYTFLRLIEDHNPPHLLPLRQKEVNFVISLIRERFLDVITLGRDLMRLLQNVARIPEFHQLWLDILQNPKSLSPNFHVLQILQTRTSRRYLQSRLTPDMERKLFFLTSQVRFGNHKRYQDWFQRQYLATPESQTLRSDMIRFIVGVIHPTNELLCSDIIPRWAVIGWLLTTCTSMVAASNAKLALFYDWLLYEPDKDNIMNVEPAILVMHHSMRSHPAVTATLLDFLCRIIPNFYPALTDKVRQGIFNALRQIVEKRVLPNLHPLFDSPKLDRELRLTVRETFKEFCASSESASSGLFFDGAGPASDATGSTSDLALDSMPHADEPVFSDDEEDDMKPQLQGLEDDTDDDDLPLSEVRARERLSAEELAGALPPTLRPLAEKLFAEKSNSGRSKTVLVVLDEAVDCGASPAALADLLTAVLQDWPPPRLKVYIPKGKELSAAMEGAIFAMFECLLQKDDKRRKLVLECLKDIHQQNSFKSVGYLLLFYLKAIQAKKRESESDHAKRRDVPFRGDVYEDYCSFIGMDLVQKLGEDFVLCRDNDPNILVWITPDVYREYESAACNHTILLHCIVSVLDGRQLRDLVCIAMQGFLSMFKPDNICEVLDASLGWETLEQYSFWQLLSAHDVSVDNVLPLMTKVNIHEHSEAVTAIILLLRQERPSGDVLRQLFSRALGNETDQLLLSIITYWCQDFEERVAELISVLVSSRYPSASPNKRKRSSKNTIPSNAPPTAEQVLGHLEHLRTSCIEQDDMSFFNMECMQKALQQAQSNSSESVKKQYSDLFMLAWQEEPPVSRRSRKSATQPPTSSSSVSRILPSSNDESEEEEIIKPKQAKRRKKAMSDSD